MTEEQVITFHNLEGEGEVTFLMEPEGRHAVLEAKGVLHVHVEYGGVRNYQVSMGDGFIQFWYPDHARVWVTDQANQIVCVNVIYEMPPTAPQ